MERSVVRNVVVVSVIRLGCVWMLSSWMRRMRGSGKHVMESVFHGIRIVVENDEHYDFENKRWMYFALHIFKDVILTW